MNVSRRVFSVACLALGVAQPVLVHAQASDAANFPSQPIKVVVPFAPGGIVDVMSRVLTEPMGKDLNQPMVVENRPGATGAIGTAQLKGATPDGHTLLFATSGIELMNPYLFKNLPYAVDDLQKVSVLYDSSIALSVSSKIGVNTFEELIEYARNKGDGLTFGSWGTGSSAHLFGSILQDAFGIKLVHVPYKGEVTAHTDLARGDLDMTWGSPNGARTFSDRGETVIIAVTGTSRSPGLPNVPTFAEQGFDGFNLGLYGVAYAPRGTPQPIIDRLQQSIADALAQPAVKERFATLGLIPVGSTPAEFEALFDRERPVWQKLITDANVSLD